MYSNISEKVNKVNRQKKKSRTTQVEQAVDLDCNSVANRQKYQGLCVDTPPTFKMFSGLE